jgi:hypothetical protein
LDKTGSAGIISDHLLPVVIGLFGAAMKFFRPCRSSA